VGLWKIYVAVVSQNRLKALHFHIGTHTKFGFEAKKKFHFTKIWEV